MIEDLSAETPADARKGDSDNNAQRGVPGPCLIQHRKTKRLGASALDSSDDARQETS